MTMTHWDPNSSPYAYNNRPMAKSGLLMNITSTWSPSSPSMIRKRTISVLSSSVEVVK